MTNKEISQKLENIAKYLEIIEENQFKVIAYERASRLIEMQSSKIEDIYKKEGLDGLKNISGIGQSIAEKIEEFIKTGKITYEIKLAKKIPSVIIDFLNIPGVGPKTAKKLYQTFKIDSINKLKKELFGKKHLNKFKPKTRTNIIRGIDMLSKFSNRMLLSEAYPVANNIMNVLKKYPNILQTDIVGSLRRGKETIGDIDIVATLKKIVSIKDKVVSKNTIEKFCQESFVKKIISKGNTKVTIIDNNDIQIDLEILPSDEYGSLIQHFTGSKEHNIALRTYAEKQGFSISEHGIKLIRNKIQTTKPELQINSHAELVSASRSKIREKFQGDNLIKCDTEEKVYQTLKMNTPEPEIRENQGEIEASLKHNLPKLVKLSDIKGDLQMHSNFSDGQNTIYEMALSCKKLDYQYLGITDHPATLGITQGLKNKDIDKYIFSIKKAQEKAKIRIFSSIEANIKPDGSMDLPDNILAKFDYVIGSIHSSFAQDIHSATKRIIKAIVNPYVGIIGHPTGRIINKRRGLEFDWEKVFISCKKYNKILEINAYPDRLDIKDTVIREAIKQNIKLIINTDSHSTNHLTNMIYGVLQARRGWAERKNIINTYSLSEIKKVLNIPK